jgi:hypothetical protein
MTGQRRERRRVGHQRMRREREAEEWVIGEERYRDPKIH